jgi:uncharacterized protein YjiS (DUF1127 family)
MSTTGGRWIAGFGAQFRQRLERGLAGVRHRKGLAMLANFDDHALADIGLTRADLYDALAQRIWDDPTTMLECRRTARRDEARQVPALAAPKSPPQMLGVRGLSPPPTDRPARYFV